MTIPELAAPSPNFHTTPVSSWLRRGLLNTTPVAGDLAITCGLSVQKAHGGSSTETDVEPGTLRSQGRDLTTRQPQSCPIMERYESFGRIIQLFFS
ncbi:hypothetical protein AVEN_196082-1 [Araneus ventricosus]|uniref:Uncharacterized protein n=1 Tax=Araneus ventricosus TaxID=182803 RepID=A0A4Y2Q1Y9_ARAVE|nr:hypothetical protein AVEN_196082-1 [Araneus ventricosus]